MLHIEFEKDGSVIFGKSAYNFGDFGIVSINYGIDSQDSQGQAIMARVYANYSLTKLSNENYSLNTIIIRVYRDKNNVVKFAINDIDDVTMAVLHPSNSSASLLDMPLIGTVKVLSYSTKWADTILTIVPGAGAQYYQKFRKAATGFELVDDYDHLSIDYSINYYPYPVINSLDVKSKSTIDDVEKTTSSLLSETAAKYVSR